MTAWTIRLDFTKPPAGLSMNDRVHWSRKAKATRAVRRIVAGEVRDLELPQLARIRVDVVWVVATGHRRDTDNLAPLLKAIYDGIGSDTGISAHLVPDDTPEYMDKPGATIRLERSTRPHFEITITDLSTTKGGTPHAQ